MATRWSRDGATAVTSGRDAPRVLRLTTFLRSLGPAGAVANARAVLDERRREDWAVDGLLLRLDLVPVAPTAAPVEPAARVA